MRASRWSAGPGLRRPDLQRALLLVVALALAALAAVLGSPPPGWSVLLPMTWWLLAVLFAIAEWGPVSARFVRHRRRLTLTPLPLAAGLLLCGPRELVGGMLAGALVSRAVRRPGGVRCVVDEVTLTAFMAATAISAVGLVSAAVRLVPGGVTDHGPSGWTATVLCVLAAVVTAEWVRARVGEAVLGLDGLWPLNGVRDRAEGWFDAALSGLVAVPVVAVTLRFGGVVSTALLMVLACALIGYRAQTSLSRRQGALERLYQVSGALVQTAGPVGADPSHTDMDDLVRSVLEQSMGLLNARYAELVWLDEEGAQIAWVLRAGSAQMLGPAPPEPYTTSLGSVVDRPRLLRPGNPDDLDALAARGSLREAMVAPLSAGSVQRRGHLLLADGQVVGSGFSQDDLRLLVTVANQAAVGLANAGLIRRLHREARADELTGLPNRAHFRELIEDSCDPAGASRGPGGWLEPFAVMLLDFDGFKAINDTLGHATGDVLLKVIARRLAAAVDQLATVARLGGDEFAVIAPGCRDQRDAMALARRLLAVFDEPVEIDQARLRLGGSLGISLFPEHGDNTSDLMRNADLAMYAAKAGAGGARMFTEDLLADNALALTLGGDLRDAIARDEVEVAVQPVIRMATDELHSVEVLARWHHPVIGDILPRTFFAAAEQAGLTPALSVQILHRALRLCRGWLDQGRRVRVAVNVAPRWLADTSLPEIVGAALATHGVPADLLTLELTERGVIADPRRVTETLHRLHDLGVHLSVDDFGTGYSSLSYLSQLPVDQLKIDEVFVARVGGSERDLSIVRSLVDLGRHLNLEVVAEGVSDQGVRDILTEVGCPLGQGFLFAHPFDPSELDGFVVGGNRLGTAV